MSSQWWRTSMKYRSTHRTLIINFLYVHGSMQIEDTSLSLSSPSIKIASLCLKKIWHGSILQSSPISSGLRLTTPNKTEKKKICPRMQPNHWWRGSEAHQHRIGGWSEISWLAHQHSGGKEEEWQESHVYRLYWPQQSMSEGLISYSPHWLLSWFDCQLRDDEFYGRLFRLQQNFDASRWPREDNVYHR